MNLWEHIQAGLEQDTRRIHTAEMDLEEDCGKALVEFRKSIFVTLRISLEVYPRVKELLHSADIDYARVYNV
ncbi:MAG: hypothetical protein ACREIQ_09065 [Nitrospiria bacterium]